MPVTPSTDRKMLHRPAEKPRHPHKAGSPSSQPLAAIEAKREREKHVVREMIGLYCTKNHHAHPGELCEECAQLADYACRRSDKCPFMETKTFCSNCTVHCYKPEMRARIREVMAFSGPRMLLVRPLMVLRHMWESLRERRRLAKVAKAKASALNIAAAQCVAPTSPSTKMSKLSHSLDARHNLKPAS